MTRSLQHRFAFHVLVACLGLSGCSLLPGAGEEDDGGDSDDGDNGGGKGGGGKGGSGGGGNSACSGCADAACSNEASNCDSTAGCRDVLDCILGCDATDATCQAGCVPQTTEGAYAYAAAATYYSCAVTSCYQQCVAGVGGSSGGGGTSGSGGSAGDAGSGNAGAGGSNGGSAGSLGGSAGSAGSMGGSAGATGGSGGTGALGPGVHWISFEGSWADASVEPNGSLGISGAVYAFADSCAQITWNETTRCVTGMLCDPGANFENWGMAIGFDFHNTGAAGTPPNTKMPWNAATVNARGIAYEVTGTAPALQAWITNMDPMWNGMCTADDCGINGPPDGTAAAALGMVGNLYFNSLQKDDWGGTGTVYTFSPSNILSLQLKLASVASGPVAFNFCVSRIGIII